jgi:hypothetical protein
MSKIIASCALLLALVGCRTPAHLGGEYSHRETAIDSKAPLEEFVRRDRWVFFWGLMGTEEIDVPEVGGGFEIENDVGKHFANNEHLVDLIVEEGNTIPGIVTSIFTLGIVNQREVVVKARRVTVGPATPPPPQPQ